MSTPSIVPPDGDGWVDLAVTFADAGLAVPPIPAPLRHEVVRVSEWCWSTRADIDPTAMYMFSRYVTEAIEGPVEDYVAVSHAGHGANSYGLNFHLVHGGLGVFTQHGWGGVYMDPVEAKAEIAYTYAFLDQLVTSVAPGLPAGRLSHLLCYSQFRGACCFLSRGDSADAQGDSGRPPAPGWRRHEFSNEHGLLAFAANTLCPEPREDFALSVQWAMSRT